MLPPKPESIGQALRIMIQMQAKIHSLQRRVDELKAEIIELRDECSNAEAIQPPPGQSDD